MTQGIVRVMDRHGRIMIPKNIRKQLSIGEGDLMEILTEEDRLVLAPYKLKCVVCGMTQEEALKEVEGVHLCLACIQAFQEK